ncbi:MAG TPA: type IV secretion system DNA-binding domain-containing protein [Steroidobacteraceae bacterium]|nr:type IV secretion system DNA-binding domain-containing protein [Steroidobacteraceae bacterium]
MRTRRSTGGVSSATYASTTQLILLYPLLALPMLGGLLHGRAPLSRLLLWPVSSAFFALVVGAIVSLLRGALAPSMPLSHPHLLDGAGLLLIPILGYGLGRVAARTIPAQVHQRGTRVPDGRCAQQSARKRLRTQPKLITLAGIAVERLDETKHFKLIGTTGSGKSTAIREVLRIALARGDRALIADPDGGYLNRFYDPDRGDVILNPFDPRSARWDLFGELRDPYDADQLARALIPDAADTSGREWRAYARTFLASVLRTAHLRSHPCPRRHRQARHRRRSLAPSLLRATARTPTAWGQFRSATPRLRSGVFASLHARPTDPLPPRAIARTLPTDSLSSYPRETDRRPMISPSCGAGLPSPPRRTCDPWWPTPPPNPFSRARTRACSDRFGPSPLPTGGIGARGAPERLSPPVDPPIRAPARSRPNTCRRALHAIRRRPNRDRPRPDRDVVETRDL